jgi:hypothetical protein
LIQFATRAKTSFEFILPSFCSFKI